MLAATIFLYSLGSLVAGLAPNIPVFLLGRALVGFGVGGEWAIGHAMVAEAIAVSTSNNTTSLPNTTAAITIYFTTNENWQLVKSGNSCTTCSYRSLVGFAFL